MRPSASSHGLLRRAQGPQFGSAPVLSRGSAVSAVRAVRRQPSVGHTGAATGAPAGARGAPVKSAWSTSADEAKVAADSAEAEPETTLLADVNKYIRFHPTEDITSSPDVVAIMQRFVDANTDVSKSPNLKRQAQVDDMSCLSFQLQRCLMHRKPGPALLVLTAFKILMRKAVNRTSMPQAVLKQLIDALKLPLSMRCAAESANVILNLCYEESNVDTFLDLGGMHPLVRFLSTPNPELQASACGALQSVCFQTRGRVLAREAGALPPLCDLLAADDDTVVLRAVGALHNISSDPLAIPVIRDAGGVLPLVKLLRKPSSEVCASAAGAIQNLSREPSVRALIAEGDAIEPLADLLVCAHPQTQVCAAGALLNLLGPAVSDTEDPTDPDRVALRSLLSDGIALGAIMQCLTEPSSDAATTALTAHTDSAAPAVASSDDATLAPDS